MPSPDDGGKPFGLPPWPESDPEMVLVPFLGWVPTGLAKQPTRPGPQPHNAGITPGFEHLVADDLPVTRAELRRLAGMVDQLERRLRRGRC